ncbi:CPBP family intramembrane glutamic endopeptidase [Cyclobacterium plantarum]|uniref:CPBP family intramembrane glutamic endopeptidase n=1 Tax=Cyclobacterium plantarum TaxID=2716263 RepID=UPI003F72C157
MIKIICITIILLFPLLAIRGLFIIYKNRINLREITGIYFFKFLSKISLFLILIFILFLLITIINYNKSYIILQFTKDFKLLFLQIPQYLSIAIIEEFLFRVLLFVSLIHYVQNKNMLIIISSLFFALFHFPINALHFTSYFLAGFMYGYSFVKFQSILLPIGIHFFWNYIQGAIFGYPVSGAESDGLINLTIISNEIYNGGNQGIEGSYAGLFMRIIIIFSIYILPSEEQNEKFLNFLNPFLNPLVDNNNIK